MRVSQQQYSDEKNILNYIPTLSPPLALAFPFPMKPQYGMIYLYLQPNMISSSISQVPVYLRYQPQSPRQCRIRSTHSRIFLVRAPYIKGLIMGGTRK